MKRRQSIQYSLRQVPEHVDRAVKEQASRYGRSMNATALAALEKGLGLGADSVRYHDLDDLSGSWVRDPGFDAAVAALRRVEKDFWK